MEGVRLTRPLLQQARCSRRVFRALSTLPTNPHIYYFGDRTNSSIKHLTFLPTSPPNLTLVIGHTTAIPPEHEPQSFTANPTFTRILQAVVAANATRDPNVQAQAAAYASQAGSTLSAVFQHNHPSQSRQRSKRSRPSGPGSTSGAGPSASQGGMGGGGRGGWVHVSDLRRPPDWGRIADPEDIFGSVEVDSEGKFIGEDGNYQESGTYRVVTRDGILQLSPFLREKLVERLRALEKSS